MWLVGWVVVFIGGLCLGAALYLAIKPVDNAATVINKIPSESQLKPVAHLLLQSRRMDLSDRESVKQLLTELNVEIAHDVAWSVLLAPERLGDGVIALHELDNRYWLQVPTADGGIQWLASDAAMPRPDFLYPETDARLLISGHLPKAFWQRLLPDAEQDSCLLWPQVQNSLPEQAAIEVDVRPLTFRLTWAWPQKPQGAKFLPDHDPRKSDALYSAALTEASEHCDDNPYVLRLWPSAKKQAQLAILQQHDHPTDSPLQEFSLRLHAVKNVSGALASSNEGDQWLSSAWTAEPKQTVLYRNYVNTQRVAALTPSTEQTEPQPSRSVDLLVWWHEGQITLQMQWENE